MADLAFCCMLVVMSQFEYSQTVSRTMGIQVNKGNVNPTHPRSRVLPPSSSKASALHRSPTSTLCAFHGPTESGRVWVASANKEIQIQMVYIFFAATKQNIFTNLCAAFSIFRCSVKVFYIIYKDSTSGSCGAYGYISFFFPCSGKQTYGSVCGKTTDIIQGLNCV